MQLLNNLFQVCSKIKNADIFCYKVTSFYKKIAKKFKKMKRANTDRESFHIF